MPPLPSADRQSLRKILKSSSGTSVGPFGEPICSVDLLSVREDGRVAMRIRVVTPLSDLRALLEPHGLVAAYREAILKGDQSAAQFFLRRAQKSRTRGDEKVLRLRWVKGLDAAIGDSVPIRLRKASAELVVGSLATSQRLEIVGELAVDRVELARSQHMSWDPGLDLNSVCAQLLDMPLTVTYGSSAATSCSVRTIGGAVAARLQTVTQVGARTKLLNDVDSQRVVAGRQCVVITCPRRGLRIGAVDDEWPLTTGWSRAVASKYDSGTRDFFNNVWVCHRKLEHGEDTVNLWVLLLGEQPNRSQQGYVDQLESLIARRQAWWENVVSLANEWALCPKDELRSSHIPLQLERTFGHLDRVTEPYISQKILRAHEREGTSKLEGGTLKRVRHSGTKVSNRLLANLIVLTGSEDESIRSPVMAGAVVGGSVFVAAAVTIGIIIGFNVAQLFRVLGKSTLLFGSLLLLYSLARFTFFGIVRGVSEARTRVATDLTANWQVILATLVGIVLTAATAAR
jgi:hypothetical protein